MTPAHFLTALNWPQPLGMPPRNAQRKRTAERFFPPIARFSVDPNRPISEIRGFTTDIKPLNSTEPSSSDESPRRVDGTLSWCTCEYNGFMSVEPPKNPPHVYYSELALGARSSR